MAQLGNNPFANHQDKYMRFFGGSAKENPIDPYITGYHYIFFELPTELRTSILNQIREDNPEDSKGQFGSTGAEIEQILNIHNLSLTPPTTTLNKTTMTGVGGTKWHVPTNLDISDTFTVRYNEYSGLPIYSIHRYWVNAIRNQFLGIGNITGAGDDKGLTYQPDYKANVIYATVRPDMQTVEFAALYTGVFPTKIPQDSFASDLATSDKIEVDIDYHVDFMYDNNPDVIQKVKTLISTSRAAGVLNNENRPKLNPGS